MINKFVNFLVDNSKYRWVVFYIPFTMFLISYLFINITKNTNYQPISVLVCAISAIIMFSGLMILFKVDRLIIDRNSRRLRDEYRRLMERHLTLTNSIKKDKKIVRVYSDADPYGEENWEE